MNDNKAFAAWMLFVIGGAATLLLSLILVGGAMLPPLPTVMADLALGLCVRFAYKWVGGFDSADWSITGEATGHAIAADGLHGQPAGAMG